MSSHISTPAALGLGATAIMVGLCASWGITQVAIKVVLGELGPVTQSAIRAGLASCAVLVWCSVSGRMPRFTRQNIGPGLWLGVIFAIEFILLFVGVQWTTASRSTLFLYSNPFFVALGAWFLLPEERLRPLQIGGMVLAFSGLILAFGEPGGDKPTLLGDLLVLASAIGWAGTTLLIKTTQLQEESAETITLYQLLAAALLGGCLAVVIGDRITFTPSLLTVTSILYQAVWVAGFTYVIWFGLVSRYPASLLAAYTFLTPLFGVAAGYFLLQEPITVRFAIASCLVIAGLILVNRPPKRREVLAGREG